MNEIGRWREAWGPRPVKVKDRPAPFSRPRYSWHDVHCTSPDCRNTEPIRVYGPVTEVYVCAVCEAEMARERT